MAAPDLPTIYDFEDTLAAAFAAYLTAETVGATPQITRDPEQQTPPALLIKVEHGGAFDGITTDAKLFTTDGNTSKDRHFAGQLITTIRTNRQADQTDDDHATIRKRTRAALYDCLKATAGINAQLTYHSIRSISEEGTSYGLGAEDGFDDTEISWAVSYVILESAWP